MIRLPLVDPQTLAVFGTLPWPHSHPPAHGIGFTHVIFAIKSPAGAGSLDIKQVAAEVSFILARQVYSTRAAPKGEWCFTTDNISLDLAVEIDGFEPAVGPAPLTEVPTTRERLASAPVQDWLLRKELEVVRFKTPIRTALADAMAYALENFK